MKAEFRFIGENTFLIAFVDDKSGKQQLIMEHRDDSGNALIRDKIDCIHTAVMDIPVEDFEDAIGDERFETKLLNIRSSENLKEVKLAPKERFKAFKSWVAGIAEAGYEALFLQNQIESQARLQYPIAQPLMKFLAKCNLEFVYYYIDWVERECRYEGVKHGPSIIANFDFILESLAKNSYGLIISEAELFKVMDLMLEIYPVYLSHVMGLNNRNLKVYLAKNSDACEFEEYKLFFTDEDWNVRNAVRQNAKAKEIYPELYAGLFPPEFGNDRIEIASNEEALKFEEYKFLFTD